MQFPIGRRERVNGKSLTYRQWSLNNDKTEIYMPAPAIIRRLTKLARSRSRPRGSPRPQSKEDLDEIPITGAKRNGTRWDLKYTQWEPYKRAHEHLENFFEKRPECVQLLHEAPSGGRVRLANLLKLMKPTRNAAVLYHRKCYASISRPTLPSLTRKRDGSFKARCVVLGNRINPNATRCDVFSPVISQPGNKFLPIEGAGSGDYFPEFDLFHLVSGTGADEKRAHSLPWESLLEATTYQDQTIERHNQ